MASIDKSPQIFAGRYPGHVGKLPRIPRSEPARLAARHLPQTAKPLYVLLDSLLPREMSLDAVDEMTDYRRLRQPKLPDFSGSDRIGDALDLK